MASLERVLARLALHEDTQDRLEHRNFDKAKSLAAIMLCIPEHGRMCARDVKEFCFECERVPQAASVGAEAMACCQMLQHVSAMFK